MQIPKKKKMKERNADSQMPCLDLRTEDWHLHGSRLPRGNWFRADLRADTDMGRPCPLGWSSGRGQPRAGPHTLYPVPARGQAGPPYVLTPFLRWEFRLASWGPAHPSASSAGLSCGLPGQSWDPLQPWWSPAFQRVCSYHLSPETQAEGLCILFLFLIVVEYT